MRMKAKALSVKECSWTSDECHLVDERHGKPYRDRLCLPNLFRSKKVKPVTTIHSGPTTQVYRSAKELFLEVLDREAVRELARRAAAPVKTGRGWPSYSQSREPSTDLPEGQYAEAVTWFSIVLQSGLTVGHVDAFDCELALTLEGWQGILKRNSFQTNLLSLSQLEDGDKLEALCAFCGHLVRHYRGLYTPGQHLTVKKYSLSYQHTPCPLHLALLCEVSSGFICNMYLYCPEQLWRSSGKPVVEQVVVHLLKPFCSHRHLVQLDSSAWMEGRLTSAFSNAGITIHFAPSVKEPGSSTSSPPSGVPHQHHPMHDGLPSQLVAHLQGWTGPGLFPLSDLRGSAADYFLPGLCVTLHVMCINTFVLHTLQNQGSSRDVNLTDFTRTLASQLAKDSSVSVPILPHLQTGLYPETLVTNASMKRTNTNSCKKVVEKEQQGFSSAMRLHRWSQVGVCGLDNSGNSCYLNAVLQCLCATVPLVEHLLNQDTSKELARRKCRVAEVFVRLLETMWLGKSSTCSPLEARSVLCSIFPQFNNDSQQDAQEVLLFLLNALHDDLKKACSSTRQLRQDRHRNCTTATGNSTIVSHLFEGHLSYMTLCMHCDHQVYSTQKFTMLSLPIPTESSKCSIQDCLCLFFEQTLLTGAEQMMCSSCGLRRDTTVLTCLENPPEILMLHLKRFGCRGKNQVKLRTNVTFSTGKLDLTPFLSSSVKTTSSSSYYLYGVVNHMGHLNMGHYTALCRNALTRIWNCFDDSVVQEVQDRAVQSPHAYILLYSRKPFRRPKIHGF